MTSNKAVDVIHDQLDWMNKKDEQHIRITYAVGLSVEFLDVHVENVNGALVTSVFHKPAAEPYVLPYSSDHPRHVHVNIPYEALLRAARLCSNVYAFDRERLGIEMVLLLNGYPPMFIQRHFERFFRINQATIVRTEINSQQYDKLHKTLLYLPTRREKRCQRNSGANEEINHRAVKKPWNKNIMRVSHTFERGPLLDFKREFRCLWKKYYVYKGSTMKEVYPVFTSLTNPSLNDLLVKKKPARSTFTKMEALSSSSADKVEGNGQ